jgi:hypothetical protein
LYSFDIFGLEDADPSKPPSAKSLGSVLEDNEEPSQFIDVDGEDEDKKLKKKMWGLGTTGMFALFGWASHLPGQCR